MQNSSPKRIVKNTIYLYVRQLFTMIISLYTVRVVLNILGVVDYGIYNVVGGAVTMFSFFVGTMASSSQRYYSYMLGKNDNKGLQKVFNTTFILYIIIAFIILVLSETVGLWFVYNKLSIPLDRFNISLIVFHISVLSCIINLIAAPYVSSIIAHEHMDAYAKISIFESLFKLVTVFILTISNYDKLILYSLLQLTSCIFTSLIYIKYCKTKFFECQITFKEELDKNLFKEITYFSTWSLLGNISGTVKNQGSAFLLNIFFGPILNTAQTIANQVRTYSSMFFQNFSTATKPQIIKLYANKEYDNMFNLVFKSCKLTYFLMLVVILPLIYNIDFILKIWLSNVPPYVSIFTKILLFESLIDSISSPMSAANMATGKIKNYQIAICLITLLNLPLAYIFLKNNFCVEIVFLISLFLQTIITITRTIFVLRIKKGKFKQSLKLTFIPCIIVSSISFLICFLLFSQSATISDFIINSILQILIICSTIFIVGLDNSERTLLIFYIKKKLYGNN